MGSDSNVPGCTVTSTIGGVSGIPRSLSRSVREGRSPRNAPSRPGAPTTCTVVGSSPRAKSRRACSSWLTRCRWLSLVIACLSASSKAPKVCSPPWRWMIGTSSSVAASAAAAVSDRSPATSRASGRELRSAAPTAWSAAAVSPAAPPSPASPIHSSRTSGGNPSASISSTVRPYRAARCMPPAINRSSRRGCARIAAAVE